MQQTPSVTEVTASAKEIAESYNKNPWGTTVAIAVVMLLIGIFFGRYTASSEIESANDRANKLQATQDKILIGSLEKNKIITNQSSEIKTQKDSLQITRTENDTLKSTLTQVGSALMQAKNPAVKILNK